MDLRTLEVAAAAIETGSMSETAIRFGLTQSGVSQAVGRAEKIIGTKLLRRDRRPMTPTAAGIELTKQIGDLLHRAHTVVDIVRSAANVPERLDLRLGMADSFAGTVGPSLLKELIEDASAVRLTAWSGLSPNHIESLLNHSVDAVIAPGETEDEHNFCRYPIFREPYVLVVRKSERGIEPNFKLADIFASHHLIRHSARSHSGMQVDRHLRRLHLEPPRKLECDTSDALISMVASGVGVAITTPLCLLQGNAQYKDVLALRLPGPGFSRELAVVTRRDELTSLGPRIAEMARRLIIASTLPLLRALVPWMRAEDADAMVLSASITQESEDTSV